MKLSDHLSKEQKLKLKQKLKQKYKSKKKKHKQEHVNWKEIMGMNRDIYKRVRGAWRNK